MIEKAWKGTEIEEAFAECKTLGDIIEKVTKDSQAENNLVCDIRVNGEFLSEERERELSHVSKSSVESFEIVAQSPIELLKNSMGSQIQLLQDLKMHIVHCYTKFRVGNPKEAHSEFCTVLEGCQFLAEALGLIKQNLRDQKVISLKNIGWSDAETRFESTVREILDAYEKEDFQLAADAMEYDLQETLDQWRETLRIAKESL